METKEIRPFIALCNNFIDAKYIMMGNNIVKLIECINEDDSLREVVKKCMVNFDFTTELGLALSATKAIPKDFIMPKENEKVVALCYSVLQQIALNQIDYEAFISKHFIYDGTISDVYKNFGHYFILPFKNAVLYLENAKCINNVRGMLGFTGTYKNKTVTVFASGMGNPSMGIYSYELYKYYGIKERK